MRSASILATLPMILWTGRCVIAGGDGVPPDEWRSLPLIKDGKVDPGWVQVGWGGFVVEDGSLRTECDKKGLGLLLYRKEKFGDCQIWVVYRSRTRNPTRGCSSGLTRVSSRRWGRGTPPPGGTRPGSSRQNR